MLFRGVTWLSGNTMVFAAAAEISTKHLAGLMLLRKPLKFASRLWLPGEQNKHLLMSNSWQLQGILIALWIFHFLGNSLFP
jgi:hypothetical protein